MKESKLYPERAIFVDDKVKNVTDVEAALSRASFPHISFRYGAADPRVASFDRNLAELEWTYYLRFGVILSDADAYRLMNPRPAMTVSENNFSNADTQ
jgi:hypothetical protein